MGSEGMKYSIVSREVIADSIETVGSCGMDGFSFSAGEKVAAGRMRCGALTVRFAPAIGGCDIDISHGLNFVEELNSTHKFIALTTS